MSEPAKIERYGYCYDTQLEPMPDGDWVLYEDHEAKVIELVTIIAQLHHEARNRFPNYYPCTCPHCQEARRALTEERNGPWTATNR